MTPSSDYLIITHSARQTQEVGRLIGRALDRAMVLRLTGDLGSGKTCFVQGLARGLDVAPGYDITSPSYTLIHEYPGRLTLYHVDLYRLGGPGGMADIGLDDILYQNAVAAVEWADRLPGHQWPDNRLDIDFALQKDDSRRIRLTPCGLAPDNLIKELLVNAPEVFKGA